MYPAEEDFGLDHPISTILPDYPALYDDYEYDDYILLPLTLPGVLIPSPGLPEEPYGLYSEDLLSPPPQYNFVVSEFDDDDDEPLLSTPLSPSYTTISDYVFPDVEASTSAFTVAGYSKLFRSGLVSKSRGITRHFDVWLKKLKDTFRKLVRST